MSEGIDDLASYDAILAVLAALPILVREKRRRLGLSLRGAAVQADLTSFSTVDRCERGADLAMTSVIPLLRWVGTPDTVNDPGATS